MKSTILLTAALVLALSAGSAFAQQPPNAPRRIEVSYTGNLRYFLGFGFVRKGGWNLGGACLQVAVKVTDSGSVVGEMCGTHQFVARPRSPGNDTPQNSRWPLSEPGHQVDSLQSFRGGIRFSTRTGGRLTTFVQGLAGIERGYQPGGFAGNSGFSFAAGGGADVSLTNWLSLEAARAMFQTTRVGGTTVNGLRFGTGLVARIGETPN